MDVQDRHEEHGNAQEMEALKAKLAFFKMVIIAGVAGILGFAVGYMIGSSHSSSGTETPSAQVAQQPAAPQAQAQAPQGPPVLPGKDVLPQIEKEGLVTYIGNKDAKVTMHEFIDFQCPACRAANAQFMIPFKKQFVETGKVRFGLIHWPLEQIHPYANMSAKSFLCAVDNGAKANALADTLLSKQPEWVVGGTTSADSEHVRSKLAEYAKNAGANADGYATCLKGSKKYDARFAQDGRLAFNVGAQGTPTFFLNGERLVSGGMPELVQKIDSIIKH